MIYETRYFRNIQGDLFNKQKLKAYLEEIGFINIPNPNPGYQEDPDRYYWENDTRREFYVCFPGRNGSLPWAHITSGGTDYDYQLAPWNGGGGVGDVLGTYTPLFNGGIRFGMRARRECLFGYYQESQTDYRAGYRNEEMDAALYPAHWFAIIAPEDNTRDEWCYILFQKDLGAVEEGSSQHKYNFQYPVLYFHDGVIEPEQNMTQGMPINDIQAGLNSTYPLMPCLLFDGNGNPIKEYTNVFFSKQEYTNYSPTGRHKTNKIINYNDEQYICMTYIGPYVRFR